MSYYLHLICALHYELIFIIFLLSFLVHRVDTNFFVILLQSSHVFTSFRELTFFHTFSDVPMHERTFGIHKIELMIKTSPCLSDGGGVAQHADCTLHLSQITTWYDGRGLVVDTHLESSWAPIDELDGTFGFDGGNGSVDILGHNVATEQQTAGHVLAMTRIAFHHLVGRFEASVGDLRHRELLVVGLLCRDNRGIGGQREMDTRVGHQVGLEFSKIYIQSTIESQ